MESTAVEGSSTEAQAGGRAQRVVGVLTVDDHELFRRAAADIIEATDGFEMIGEAACGKEALALVGTLEPELVLMDVRMPEMSGVEAARLMKDAYPETTIALITMEDFWALPPETASCGAVAVIRKQDFGPLLLRVVRVVCGLSGAPHPAEPKP
jgi:DNA-binding NarL/FixJ family response regulator